MLQSLESLLVLVHYVGPVFGLDQWPIDPELETSGLVATECGRAFELEQDQIRQGIAQMTARLGSD